MTRRNNIRPEVKFLAHSTSSHAHHARITFFRFLPSLLHLPIQYANKQHITGEGFTLFCLHLPSPVLPLYPTPSVKAFWGEAFTLITLQFKPLQYKGEEVKAKIEKQWMRVMRARGKNAFTAPRPTHPLRLDNHPRQKTTVGNMVFHYRTGHKNAPISPHSGASCRRHYENKRKKFATSEIMRNFVA